MLIFLGIFVVRLKAFCIEISSCHSERVYFFVTIWYGWLFIKVKFEIKTGNNIFYCTVTQVLKLCDDFGGNYKRVQESKPASVNVSNLLELSLYQYSPMSIDGSVLPHLSQYKLYCLQNVLNTKH